MNTEKFVIDTRETTMKLSFLIGRTILMRTANEDSCVATKVESIMAKNTPGTEGVPCVTIYTNIGVKHINNSKSFNDIMLLDENGGLESLGEIVDRLGIYF